MSGHKILRRANVNEGRNPTASPSLRSVSGFAAMFLGGDSRGIGQIKCTSAIRTTTRLTLVALCCALFAGAVASGEIKTPIERAAEQLRAERAKEDANRAHAEAVRKAAERANAALKAAKQATRAAGSNHGPKQKERTVGGRSPSSEPLVVRIDSTVQYQTIQGFGSSARLFEDMHVFGYRFAGKRLSRPILTAAQENRILDLLYGTLGLTRVRLFFERGFEIRNDNYDPTVADMSKFDFRWTRNDELVRFARRVIARGAKTVFPSSVEFEKWMTASTDPAEFAEQIIVRLRRWRELGVDLEYYSIVNEPGYSRGGFWSGVFIRDVIRRAGPRLRAEGFTTKFVVPDDWGPAQAYERMRVILADPRAREHVGAIAFHLYRGNRNDLARLKALGKEYGIPLWMTEYSLTTRQIFR